MLLSSHVRFTETCSASAPRCPGHHCMSVFVGKVTVRPEYTLASCFNRRRGNSCGQQSLLIPLGGDRVQVVELSDEEAKAIRADYKKPLTEWLTLLGVAPAVRPLQRRQT